MQSEMPHLQSTARVVYQKHRLHDHDSRHGQPPDAGPPVNPHRLPADGTRCQQGERAQKGPTAPSIIMATTWCTSIQNTPTANTSTAKHRVVSRAPSIPSASPTARVTSDYGHHNATQLAQPHQHQNTPASILRRETLHLLSCSLPPVSSSPSSSSPPARIRATRRRTPGRADVHCRRAALTHPAA
jgi:hypothetical protein